MERCIQVLCSPLLSVQRERVHPRQAEQLQDFLSRHQLPPQPLLLLCYEFSSKSDSFSQIIKRMHLFLFFFFFFLFL